MCGLHLCEMAMLMIIDTTFFWEYMGQVWVCFFFFCLQNQFSIFFPMWASVSFFSTNFAFMNPKQREIANRDVQHLFLECIFALPNYKRWHATIPVELVQKILDTMWFLPTFFCSLHSQFFISVIQFLAISIGRQLCMECRCCWEEWWTSQWELIMKTGSKICFCRWQEIVPIVFPTCLHQAARFIVHF